MWAYYESIRALSKHGTHYGPCSGFLHYDLHPPPTWGCAGQLCRMRPDNCHQEQYGIHIHIGHIYIADTSEVRKQFASHLYIVQISETRKKINFKNES
jgi:hypothetical protein